MLVFVTDTQYACILYIKLGIPAPCIGKIDTQQNAPVFTKYSMIAFF